ncbi:MAG: hypothetical protein ACO1O6_14060 [Bacteroidota bacterium]
MKQIVLLSVLGILAACGTKTIETEKRESVKTEEHTLDKADLIESQKNENTSRNISDFIPKGYSLLDSASGNLNPDNYKDMILVLKKNDEENTSDVNDHPERRPLLVLTGNADKGFSLAARNDNTVLCVNCGGMMGDPFAGLSMENGSFTVLHYGGSAWRWSKNLTYSYSKTAKTWMLTEIYTDSYHTSDPEKAEIKTLTSKDFGKVSLEKFDIYEE